MAHVLIGAGVGAATSLATGGDPIKGALLGGVTGGAFGGAPVGAGGTSECCGSVAVGPVSKDAWCSRGGRERFLLGVCRRGVRRLRSRQLCRRFFHLAKVDPCGSWVYKSG